MRILLSLILPLFVIGCKTRESASGVKHDFGRTRVDPSGVLMACTKQTHSKAELAEAQKYLDELGQMIMAKNSATFKDVYAPQHFCFEFRDEDTVNAFARMDSRNVAVTKGLLKTFKSDAELAAVLAHELAHITMQHGPEAQHQDLAKNPVWKKESARIVAELDKLENDAESVRDKIRVFTEEGDKLEEQLNKASPTLSKKRDELKTTHAGIDTELMNAKFRGTQYLRNILKYPRPRVSFISILFPNETPPLDRADISPEYLTYEKKVQSYLNELEKLKQEEKKANPALWKKLDEAAAGYAKLAPTLRAKDESVEAKKSELAVLEKKILGDAANNWMEEDADEVGMEFFIRAGFQPLFFPEIFEEFQRLSETDAATCKLQLERNELAERGGGSHPVPCWRYYNGRVVEMKKHQNDYAPFIQKAETVHLWPGRLEKIQKNLK